MRVLRFAGALGLSLCAFAADAAAQGNGHGHAYGLTGGRGSGPSASTAPGLQSSLQPSAGKGRVFGTWLDDATVANPGDGSLTVSFGYWRTPAYREWDAPVADA